MVMLGNPASRSQERFSHLVRLLWGDITQDGLAAPSAELLADVVRVCALGWNFATKGGSPEKAIEMLAAHCKDADALEEQTLVEGIIRQKFALFPDDRTIVADAQGAIGADGQPEVSAEFEEGRR